MCSRTRVSQSRRSARDTCNSRFQLNTTATEYPLMSAREIEGTVRSVVQVAGHASVGEGRSIVLSVSCVIGDGVGRKL